MSCGVPIIQSDYDLNSLSCLAERVNHNLNRTTPEQKMSGIYDCINLDRLELCCGIVPVPFRKKTSEVSDHEPN